MNQSDNGSIASYLLQLMDRIRTDVSQRQAKLIDESSGQQTIMHALVLILFSTHIRYLIS